MKRIATLALAFVCAISTCFASSFVTPPVASAAAVAPAAWVSVDPAPTTVAHAPLKASDIRIPIGSTGTSIDLQQLSTMKVADYEKMTGKKMSWLNRLDFKLAQKKLRRSINADGTVSNKRLEKLARDMEGGGGFHAGGFFLGLFLGLIGVLIAYLIRDDNHRRRVTWAWIGWGTFVVIYLVLLLH